MAAAKQRRGLPETFAQLLHPEAPPTNLSPTLQSARSPAFFVGGAAEGRGREELGWEPCGYLHSAGCSGCCCGVGAAELVVGFVPNAGREVRWEAEGGGRWPHFYRWRGGRFPFCFLTHTLFEEGLLFIFIFFCAVAWFISRCIFLLSGFCDADHKAGRLREAERPVPDFRYVYVQPASGMVPHGPHTRVEPPSVPVARRHLFCSVLLL